MFAFWLVLYALAFVCPSWLFTSLGQHGLLILLFVYQCLLLSCSASLFLSLCVCLSVSLCACVLLSLCFSLCLCVLVLCCIFLYLFVCLLVLALPLSVVCLSLLVLALGGCGGTLCVCLSSVFVDYITTWLLYFVNSFLLFICLLFRVSAN